jgi:DNA polymerase-3 subunit delta'
MENNATEILLRAHDNNRLPHGILLHGPELDALLDACNTIAARLLNVQDPARVSRHVDFFSIRPSNKSRRIPIDDIRELMRQIQQTAGGGGRKVAVIYEADRVDSAGADTFLKTLEEPPADTTIFLLSTKPAKLGPTIRSRCHHFRVLPEAPPPPDPEWETWLDALDDWVCEIAAPVKTDRQRAALLLFTLYGLTYRFTALLETATARQWAIVKAALPEGLEDEEELAIESGVQKGLRSRRFADMAGRLCALYSRSPGAAAARALYASVKELERAAGLQEANLNLAPALEYALLHWLRAWSAART